LVIAIVDHAGDQLVAKLVHTPSVLEGSHGPAELVGLRRLRTTARTAYRYARIRLPSCAKSLPP
jgi:hypothetical protein